MSPPTTSRKEIVNRRRATWFAVCGELGLSEDDQLAIASGIVPDRYPGKHNDDGVPSRRPLFSNTRFWNRAIIYLNHLKQGRQDSHRRIDGSTSRGATEKQIQYAVVLARKLGWFDNGEEEGLYRLDGFISRQLSGEQGIRLISTLKAAEMSKVIQGLRTMVERG